MAFTIRPRCDLFAKIFRFAGSILVLMAACLMAARPAVGKDDAKIYYSVHVQSFQNLQNANAFVNSLARIGKVVFWKEAMVPNKGLFYRVYMGRFETFPEAEVYWNKLKEEGKVSYRGIHQFKGPVLPLPPQLTEVPDFDVEVLDDGTEVMPPEPSLETKGRQKTSASTDLTAPVAGSKTRLPAADKRLPPVSQAKTKPSAPTIPQKPAISQVRAKPLEAAKAPTPAFETKAKGGDGADRAAAADGSKVKPAAAPAVASAAAPESGGAVGVRKTLKRQPGRRFTDNGDGTVTDWKTGLMWVKNGWRIDFFSAETWNEAVEKCEKFGFAGHSDWRLPTLAQWRSLVDTAYECPSLVEPNPFENIIVHMPYWSSTPHKRVPTKIYTVTLYYGSISHQRKNDRAFIMPVRSLR